MCLFVFRQTWFCFFFKGYPWIFRWLVEWKTLNKILSIPGTLQCVVGLAFCFLFNCSGSNFLFPCKINIEHFSCGVLPHWMLFQVWVHFKPSICTKCSNVKGSLHTFLRFLWSLVNKTLLMNLKWPCQQHCKIKLLLLRITISNKDIQSN